MEVFLTVLIVIACLLLSVIILVQNPKEGGLNSSFAGANQIGGVKKTADFLEKATWTLAIVILALTLLTSVFKETPQENNLPQENAIEEPAPIQE